MRHRSKFFIYYLLPLVCCLLPVTCPLFPVHAQDASNHIPQTGIDLLVSPPIINLRTEPGATASAVIKVKNNNDNPEALEIEIKKFRADNNGDRPLLEDLTSTDIFPQWLSFSESAFTMNPKEWKKINVTFAPPENAMPAYYFAIVFKRQHQPDMPGKTVADGSAAVLCLVQVSSSRVYHQLDLMSLTANGFDFKTSHYIYEFLPVNFTATLTNNGNVHEIASGNIFIDWLSGHKSEVGKLSINAAGSAILPGTTRSFAASWDDGFPVWVEVKDAAGNPVLDKHGQPKRKLQWDFSKLTSFRIGKYSATLLMAYNDGVRDIPLEATVNFWVIPWRILLVLLVLIILIIIGLKNTLQHTADKMKSNRHMFHTPTPPPTSQNSPLPS